MQAKRPLGNSAAATVVRWGARLLSAGILLFWGWFLIAHLFSAEGLGARVPADYLGLTASVAGLVGLALAWKWEVLGGLITLVAYVILGVVSWRAIGGPYILWPVTATMFMSSWWLHRAVQHDTVSKKCGGST